MKPIFNLKSVGLVLLLALPSSPGWSQQGDPSPLPTSKPSASPPVPSEAAPQGETAPGSSTPIPADPTAQPESLPEIRQKPDGAIRAPGKAWNATQGLDKGLDSRSQRTFDRLRRILVLRQILQLGFTSSDIAAALPLLRSLRDINSAPPADPEKAMEEEYHALLEAAPGDPLPPSSAVKIMDAARYSRDEQGRIWSRMNRAVGSHKAEGLMHLLGQNESSISVSVVTPQENLQYRKSGDFQAAPGGEAANLIGGASPAKPQKEDYAPKRRQRNNLNSTNGQPANDPLFSQGLAPRGTPISNADPSMGTTRVPMSPATVRVSLIELIDILQEKLSVMNRRHGASQTPGAFL